MLGIAAALLVPSFMHEGQLAVECKNFQQAIKYYREAIEHFDRSIDLLPTARAWGVEGNALRLLADLVSSEKKEKYVLSALEAVDNGLETERLTPAMTARLLNNRACYLSYPNRGMDEIFEAIEQAVEYRQAYASEFLEDEEQKPLETGKREDLAKRVETLAEKSVVAGASS